MREYSIRSNKSVSVACVDKRRRRDLPWKCTTFTQSPVKANTHRELLYKERILERASFCAKEKPSQKIRDEFFTLILQKDFL